MLSQSRLVETPEGNIWSPPLFQSDERGINEYSIRLPYWTTGPKCRYQCSGPCLDLDEIEKYFGKDARQWACMN